MGEWKHRKNHAAHKRARAAGLALLQPGSPCVRCGHELWPAADTLNLDHDDDGGYLGFSHSSPCRTCSRRCNQQAGGVKAALNQGKRLRERPCIICGTVFVASRGSDGSEAATCSQQPCLNELRRVRREREPDPAPPPQSGRAW
jgi:hypothetical protein